MPQLINSTRVLGSWDNSQPHQRGWCQAPGEGKNDDGTVLLLNSFVLEGLKALFEY